MNENGISLFCPPFSLNASGVQRLQKTCRNDREESFLLTETIFLELKLPSEYQKLIYFTSSWGQEFQKQEIELKDSSGEFTFENTKGRCSAESAPFFTLAAENRQIDFAVCTSGNYRVSVKEEEAVIRLLVTDADPEAAALIEPGETYAYPAVLAHVCTSLEESYRVKQDYRKELLIHHPFYETLPIIYNHWWAYEDSHVDETVILKNARIAKKLGAEMLVLDAGWFGNGSRTEEWYSVRGDWDLINKERFPHGLTWLRGQIEEIGLTFGIWCEIEGLGKNAGLRSVHPDFAAVRDGEDLGYVCFGNPNVQEWAYETMRRLFEQCGAAYWKLDFNLDPGLGCTCIGHQHGEHDGLSAHYKGLYRVLDRLRAEFPELVIENCSSGGQRLNLEMAEHTQIHFLSDPDYSKHQMRIFKEASKWLLPKQLLHFMWSNTVTTNGSAPFENLDLDACTPDEIRYHMRLAMMHPFGISHRLTDYRECTLDLMKDNLDLYKEIIRPFVIDGTYLPVYLSEHINIFSFSNAGEVLLFLFAEEPGAAEYELTSLLKPGKTYRLTDMDAAEVITLGSYKGTCLTFSAAETWTSRLILIQEHETGAC